MLKEGDKVPYFSLSDQMGETITSDYLRGKTTVLYFYPKDDTPGCTKEACSFRDAYADILVKGIFVIGVSADTQASHAKFTDKYGLPFKLLSDPDKNFIKACGAWGIKKNYGKSYEGIIRSTLIIGPEGNIIRVFPKVSPANHAAELMKYL